MNYRFPVAIIALGIGITLMARAEEPTKPIKLFNGKDLTNFYTYLENSGKNNDPKKVFTVADGMIRVSGEEWGCFTTEKEYENYHLIVEFKWGDETHGKRKGKSRDSGVLIHCIGEDGGHGPWMESIETQIIEGGTGDFIVCAGKGKRPQITCRVEKRDGGEYFAREGGEEVTKKGGRINWWGRDPNWKDVKGFRGKNEVEKPVGEWNTLEVIVDGDTITNILNGVVMNKAYNVRPTKGKILFQSEGAEIFFRRIDLQPLDK